MMLVKKPTPELTIQLIELLVDAIDKGEELPPEDLKMLDAYLDALRKVRFVANA